MTRRTVLKSATAGVLGRNLVGAPPETWRFVSIPDFLNRDSTYPHPGFEDALSFILDAIRAEKPEFVLVAGDLVNGRWPDLLHPTREAIISSAAKYYTAWKSRMEAHGLRYYAALGDHEIGDNPWPEDKAVLVPLCKRMFREHLSMPLNGPPGHLGTAYWFTHRDVLIVAVDVFHPGDDPKNGRIVEDISAEQMEWLKDCLRQRGSQKHCFVMGHTPVLGPVRKLYSSGLMLRGGGDSEFWRVLAEHRVDAYLAGEVHAITCSEKDGVEQIAHGSLIGWAPTVNYLVVEISPKGLTLELKEIEIGSDFVAQERRDATRIWIPEQAMRRGFQTVGSLQVEQSGNKIKKTRMGVFASG